MCENYTSAFRFWGRQSDTVLTAIAPPSQVSSKHEVHLYWYFSKTSIFWSLNAHIWRHNRGTNSIRTASFHDWPFARHFPSSHNTYLQWKNLTFSASAVGCLCHSIQRERERDTVSQSEVLECSKRLGERERAPLHFSLEGANAHAPDWQQIQTNVSFPPSGLPPQVAACSALASGYRKPQRRPSAPTSHVFSFSQWANWNRRTQ